MHAFSPDAARAADQPFADLRVAAAQRAATAELPTPAEEIWRYSRIDELQLDRFTPGVATTTIEGGAGIVVDRADLAELPDVIGAEAPDIFGELNTAFMAPIVVRVPAGTVVAETIVITHEIAGDGTAVFPRLVIDAGADSEVTVVERFTSPDGEVVLVVPVLQVRAGPGRPGPLPRHQRAVRVGVADRPPAGGRRSRLQHHVGHGRPRRPLRPGPHRGPHRPGPAAAPARSPCTSPAASRCTTSARSRTTTRRTRPATCCSRAPCRTTRAASTPGLIKIRKHARGTTAFQTNRNLTLSEGAWAESVPNLEIETNDVKCSHASTVGPIDPEQRFYLESRGIPSQIAERLIVLGFFDEVLDQLPVGPLAAELRGRVSAKLDLERTLTGVA